MFTILIHMNPEIVRVGPFAIRWYGVMYLIGFTLSYLLVKYQIKKRERGEAIGESPEGISKEKLLPTAHRLLPVAQVASLYSYLILGLLIGARLSYVIFYNLPYYIQHPLEIFAVWHGGMSFHGGLIGSIIAGILFCKKFRLDFWQIADLVIVSAPIGLGLGRLGNFINGELYGRVTDVQWGMVFPAGGQLPRHPSQVYEFLLEGIALFVILWFLKDRKLKPGALSFLFLILYGSFRFFLEFFREPDSQLGFILGPFTMGQILSAVMVAMGIGLLVFKNVGGNGDKGIGRINRQV